MTVSVGGAIGVDMKLDIAGTKENLNVVAEVPAINVVNSEVATTITETQIRELPTITRNVYDLVAVAGNVGRQGRRRRASGRHDPRHRLRHQRPARLEHQHPARRLGQQRRVHATVGQDVPLDSVQEFSVITNNFSAQYGRATGGIVNVATKSGTNRFRGTGYEFFRNDKLAANTFDNKANEIEKGEFTRHQLGFSIGGPIRRDKMHFFSSLEYIRVRSADTLISWVPTPEFIARERASHAGVLRRLRRRRDHQRHRS